MASSTSPMRSPSSSSFGTSKAIPVSLMRALARLSRRPIASGETGTKRRCARLSAPARFAASAACAPQHRLPVWAHTNISSSRLSAIMGICSASVGASTRRLWATCSRVLCARAPSRSRLRAATISQASGWPARLVPASCRAPGQTLRPGRLQRRPRPAIDAQDTREGVHRRCGQAFTAARRPCSCKLPSTV